MRTKTFAIVGATALTVGLIAGFGIGSTQADTEPIETVRVVRVTTQQPDDTAKRVMHEKLSEQAEVGQIRQIIK